MPIDLPPRHRIRNFKPGDTEGPWLFRQAAVTLGEVFHAPLMAQTAALTPKAWMDLERRSAEQDMMATVRELYEIQRWFHEIQKGAVKRADGVPLMSYTQDLASKVRGEQGEFYKEHARRNRVYSAHRITEEICMRVLVDLGKLDILMHDSDGYEAFADMVSRAQYHAQRLSHMGQFFPNLPQREEFLALADHLHDQLKIYEHALGVDLPKDALHDMAVHPANIHGAQRIEEFLRGRTLDDLRRQHFYVQGMERADGFIKNLLSGGTSPKDEKHR